MWNRKVPSREGEKKDCVLASTEMYSHPIHLSTIVATTQP